MHLVIVGATDDVEGNLREGRRSRVEASTTDGTAVFVATDTIGIVEGNQQAWEIEGDVATILVVAVACASAARELIGAVEVDVELLTSTEGVALGESDLRQRTITAVGAPNEVTLDIEVVRLVEDAVQTQVEGVGIRTGRKLEVGTAEHTIGVDERGRFHMLLVAVFLPRAQTHVLEHDTWTDGGLLAVVVECQMATLDGVVELFAHGLAELHVDIADIPFLQSLLRQSVGHLETE